MATTYLKRIPAFWRFPHHEKIHVKGRTYFCYKMATGPIAICLSHLSILQDAFNEGYETIWVMEDDIAVVKDPHILSEKIEALDKLTNNKWDILFTDVDTKDKKGVAVPCSSYAKRPNFQPKDLNQAAVKIPLGTAFRRIWARYGAYSMIIRRSGIEKLLTFFKKYKIYLPYDMDYLLAEDLIAYTTTEDIVTTSIHSSTDNGIPNYKIKGR